METCFTLLCVVVVIAESIGVDLNPDKRPPQWDTAAIMFVEAMQENFLQYLP